MEKTQRVMPSMPEIGRPESYYAKLAHRAEKTNDHFAREAAKVGQYITLALDPSLSWDAKLRYFQHALKRHCVPPPVPEEDVWLFYRQLADLVHQHAGQEALRIASAEDDLYAMRIGMGRDRSQIEGEAELFFAHLLGPTDHKPPWFNEGDWEQLKIIRDQWI